MFLRRHCRLAALVALLAMLSPMPALAHVKLVSSHPMPGSRVSTSPPQIRLLFSEPIEAAMSGIVLYGPRGDSLSVAVTHEPGNVSALVAPLSPLASGRHQVRWHVLSADGHSITGTFSFSVLSAAADSAAPPAGGTIGEEDPGSQVQPPAIERFAMLARGIGMAALLALTGVAFFALLAEPESAKKFWVTATRVASVAAVAFALHFLLWIFQASATGFSGNWFSTALHTSVGRREALRSLLALVALVCCWPARRVPFVLAVSGTAVLLSAFIGHAITIDPVLSITSKIVHLLAGAVWFGGILWLLILDRERVQNFLREARKVSGAAGACAIAVLVTGLLQAGAVLSWDVTALGSTYARIAAIKLLGILVLFGFGAYNRFSVLPRLVAGGSGRDLQRTVRNEISIMALVAVLGGVLAYVSPPIP